MCVLLKLDYAKFVVFNSFLPDVIDKKPLGEPLAKERLTILSHFIFFEFKN